MKLSKADKSSINRVAHEMAHVAYLQFAIELTRIGTDVAARGEVFTESELMRAREAFLKAHKLGSEFV